MPRAKPKTQATSALQSPKQTPEVTLYTDGACLGNPGPGGWAYILKHPSTNLVQTCSGGQDQTTCNRMELMAVIEGLGALRQRSQVILCADSQYVVKGIAEWLEGWKARGWRKGDRSPVMNDDLWRQLDQLISHHDVQATWTRAHVGHIENEQCDRMASQEAKKRLKSSGLRTPIRPVEPGLLGVLRPRRRR